MKRLGAIRSVWRDFGRYAKHSSTFDNASTRSQLQGLIIRQAHAVEVGMIYRPTRPGFAQETVKQLQGNVAHYLRKYGIDSLTAMALQTLQEYGNLNTSLGQDLPRIAAETGRLLAKAGEREERDILPTPATFEPREVPEFDDLARRRRSCREYVGEEVPQEVILEAIDTALYSPSACNRQPCRVYRVMDSGKKKRVLEIQNNRSEWRMGASIVVVTADLGMYQGMRERAAGYVDGGLFCMSLAYSLNARGYGTCMLNLNVMDRDHDELRSVVGAGESEVFIMMMAFGKTPGEILVPKKYHRKADEVLSVV